MKESRKNKTINCPHKKDWCYEYILEQGDDKIEVNLCRYCEMDLFAEMKKQEVIENKMQVFVNEIQEKEFNGLDKEVQELKQKLKEQKQ
jgi:hypothetical protein